MNKKLLKKLVFNAAATLGERLGYDGCNDIYPDEPLLKSSSRNF